MSSVHTGAQQSVYGFSSIPNCVFRIVRRCERWKERTSMKFVTEIDTCLSDFRVSNDAFNLFLGESEEIRKAVISRLEAERAQDAKRIKELEKQAKDMSRPEAVRHFAMSEINKIKLHKYEATKEEIEAYTKTMGHAQQAVADLKTLQDNMLDLHKKAVALLDDMRAEVRGNQRVPLYPRYIEEEINSGKKVGLI